MEPTYSTVEALHMMSELQNDKDGLSGLWALIIEEKKRYCFRDLKLMEFYFDILVTNYVRKDLEGLF